MEAYIVHLGTRGFKVNEQGSHRMRITHIVVHIIRYNGLLNGAQAVSGRTNGIRGWTYRHLSEVSPKHTRDIVRRVVLLLPVERLSVLKVSMRLILASNRPSRAVRTRGARSKSACSSRMRLVDPLTRNVPSTSVARGDTGDQPCLAAQSRGARTSFLQIETAAGRSVHGGQAERAATYHLATTTGIYPHTYRSPPAFAVDICTLA